MRKIRNLLTMFLALTFCLAAQGQEGNPTEPVKRKLTVVSNIEGAMANLVYKIGNQIVVAPDEITPGDVIYIDFDTNKGFTFVEMNADNPDLNINNPRLPGSMWINMPDRDVVLYAKFYRQFSTKEGFTCNAEEEPKYGQLGRAEIAGHPNVGDVITIPRTVKDGDKEYKVVAVMHDAFTGTHAKKVDFSQAIYMEHIFDWAFANNTALTMVDLSCCPLLNRIDARAFMHHWKATEGVTRVILPNQPNLDVSQFAFTHTFLRHITYLNTVYASQPRFGEGRAIRLPGDKYTDPDGILVIDDHGCITKILKPGFTILKAEGLPDVEVACGGFGMKMTEAGVGTFVAPLACVMPDGLEGGVVKSVANGQVVVDYCYQPGMTVPAKEPLILRGQAGLYLLAVADAVATTDAAPENLLKAVLTDEPVAPAMDCKNYVLSNGKNGVGFYLQQGHPDGDLSDVYGKAYLSLSAKDFEAVANESNGLRLVAVGDVTGIEGVATSDCKEAIYTIAGVRMSSEKGNLPKGVYIINGRKTIIK